MNVLQLQMKVLANLCICYIVMNEQEEFKNVLQEIGRTLLMAIGGGGVNSNTNKNINLNFTLEDKKTLL